MKLHIVIDIDHPDISTDNPGEIKKILQTFIRYIGHYPIAKGFGPSINMKSDDKEVLRSLVEE